MYYLFILKEIFLIVKTFTLVQCILRIQVENDLKIQF